MAEMRCTQAVAFLTSDASSVEAVPALLAERLPGDGFVREAAEQLGAGSPSIVRLRGALPETSSAEVVIDVIDRHWPREIDADEVEFWGPLSYSQGLARAAAFNVIWEEAAQVVDAHRGVILLRLFEPPPELGSEAVFRMFRSLKLAEVAAALVGLPGLAAYFCPSGEVLLPVAMFAEMVEASETAKFPPLDLFANLRLAWLDERWALFDTVGNTVWGVRDIEIFCDSERHDLNETAQLLRQWTMQQFDGNFPPDGGATVPGPGGEAFTPRQVGDSLEPPERAVIRLVPEEWSTMPMGLPERLGLREPE